jgi:para-nitrobenzyl esterase
VRPTTPGAPHATDIPFVFETVPARYGSQLTQADAALSRATHLYWVSFAKTGVPKVAGEPAWPAYDAKTDLVMDFTNNGPKIGQDSWRSRLDLAEALSTRREHAVAH